MNLAKRQEITDAKEKAKEEKAERNKQTDSRKPSQNEETKAARKLKADAEESDEVVGKKRGNIVKVKKAEGKNVVCKRKAEAEEPDAIVVKKRGRPPKAATDQAEIQRKVSINKQMFRFFSNLNL
jgi:hypothetical protein